MTIGVFFPFSSLLLSGGIKSSLKATCGAAACGVFKALANNNVNLDIIAGTSIGGVNAAIIAGSKDDKYPEKTRTILVRIS